MRVEVVVGAQRSVLASVGISPILRGCWALLHLAATTTPVCSPTLTEQRCICNAPKKQLLTPAGCRRAGKMIFRPFVPPLQLVGVDHSSDGPYLPCTSSRRHGKLFHSPVSYNISCFRGCRAGLSGNRASSAHASPCTNILATLLSTLLAYGPHCEPVVR